MRIFEIIYSITRNRPYLVPDTKSVHGTKYGTFRHVENEKIAKIIDKSL
jgi:hypothetical protein